MDFNEAQELLGSAAASDPTIPGSEPAASAAPQSSPAPAQSPSGDDGNEPGAAGSADTVESFTPINPDDLPEALQPLAKQLQGAFTRKTQDLAELRKAYEGFGDADPRQVLEAYQFVNALQTDPRVAMQVHQELSQILQEQGFQSAPQMPQQQQFQPQDEFDMSWMDEPQPVGVSPEIQQQLNQMQQFMQQYQQQQEQQAFVYQIQQQENAIREQHPDYGQADYERIYKIAASTGDLMTAEREYSQWKDELVASFLKSKASVPAATPVSSGPAQVPQAGFASLDDPNLDAAVRERLAALGEL